MYIHILLLSIIATVMNVHLVQHNIPEKDYC